MTRKSKRELRREIEELQADGVGEIQVSSSVVTVTEEMVDEQGRLSEECETPAGADVLPTESDVVTVWSEHMD